MFKTIFEFWEDARPNRPSHTLFSGELQFRCYHLKIQRKKIREAKLTDFYRLHKDKPHINNCQTYNTKYQIKKKKIH